MPGKRDAIYARAKRPAAQLVVNDDGSIVTTPRQFAIRVQCMKAVYVTITRFTGVFAPTVTVTGLRRRRRLRLRRRLPLMLRLCKLVC